MLEQIKIIDQMANGDQRIFLALFEALKKDIMNSDTNILYMK